MQLLPYLYKYMGTDYHLIALKNVWLIIQMITGIDFMNIWLKLTAGDSQKMLTDN